MYSARGADANHTLQMLIVHLQKLNGISAKGANLSLFKLISSFIKSSLYLAVKLCLRAFQVYRVLDCFIKNRLNKHFVGKQLNVYLTVLDRLS